MEVQQPRAANIIDEEFFGRLQGKEFDTYRDIVWAVIDLGLHGAPDWVAYPPFNFLAYTEWADQKGWIGRTPEGKYVIVVESA